MLDKHEISIACLMNYIGFTLGIALLVVSEIVDKDDLGRWGIAVLCIACTYSVHRSLAAHDERLRNAFEVGREHERSKLSSVR